MRILHTSDWHLGRSFHRVSLLEAQAAYLDHLVATVREHEVDAVLVAGDVYDRAVPPLSAVELFDGALHRLAAVGVPTVMISGNHDSARRLGVGAGLIGRAGIHLRTDPADCATPVVLRDAHGEVAFYGLPYLEPALVKDVLKAERPGHEAVLTAAMERVRADLAARPDSTRSVVLAHAFVAGGEPSDSERDITVGGVAAVPAGVFDGVDYVALGHLHGCQTVTERVRYSGSPLAYSFSEVTHRKTMWLIDLDASGTVAAERVDCPVPRPLARLRGRLDELVDDPALERHRESWIEATLTDPVRPVEPMARLVERFPHTLSLVFEPDRAPDDPLASYAQRLRGRDDQQIAEDFVAHVRGGSAADEQERTVLRGAFDHVRVDDGVREVNR
ncbi:MULTISPECIES: exonuclease SbcCD subunit D [unclassified Streptomyces]|uniref:exonuclease SbcCD subunit D n=1 Tax=unclassified Streptomyces TaxID=2593676 RepID=UPI00081B54D4|nr:MULTISPECIES: exonuclease SbcCD subunit D [unclassified Streptomyces]MYQ88194.1 exonuclease subunit SbcD [Streptomyces sp. SID4936]SCE53716.1 Exodeoxyribonuclease I subunit D [Streptomyces sp. DvalAA-43]